MDSKTDLIPEYLKECVMDFDGITVKLAKTEKNMYSIAVDPGTINLDRNQLSREYRKTGMPRIEISMHTPSQDWFVPARIGCGDLHFKNGDKFSTPTANHILYNIQEGAKRLKEINADKAIRFSLTNEAIQVYTFQEVAITITRKCSHLANCDDDCKYAISIDSDLKFNCPPSIMDLFQKSPTARGVLEGTCSFTRNASKDFFLSRHINCEHGDSFYFKNGDVFTRKQLEYMLFSIKKTLDRMAELGYKVQQPKPIVKPEMLEVIISPIIGVNKVYLVVKGMMLLGKIPDEYLNKEWCCYSISNGDYCIYHNKIRLVIAGIDGKSDFLQTSGNSMTREAAKEIMTALGKCAQALHEVNHPADSGKVLKF